MNEEILREVLHYIYSLHREGNLSGQDYGFYSLCYAADKYELDHLMDLIKKKEMMNDSKFEEMLTNPKLQVAQVALQDHEDHFDQ